MKFSNDCFSQSRNTFTLSAELSTYVARETEYFTNYKYYSEGERFPFSLGCYGVHVGINRNDTLGHQPIKSNYLIGYSRIRMGFFVADDSVGYVGEDGFINAHALQFRQQWYTKLYRNWHIGFMLTETFNVNTQIRNPESLEKFGLYESQTGKLYWKKFDILRGLVLGYGYNKTYSINFLFATSSWEVFKSPKIPYSKNAMFAFQFTKKI